MRRHRRRRSAGDAVDLTAGHGEGCLEDAVLRAAVRVPGEVGADDVEVVGLSATSLGTVTLRWYSMAPSASTAMNLPRPRPLRGLVSPVVVSETSMGPKSGRPSLSVGLVGVLGRAHARHPLSRVRGRSAQRMERRAKRLTDGGLTARPGEPPGTCRASSKDPSTPWRARDRSDDQPARVGIAFPASRPVRRCVAGRERHPHPDATGLRRRRVPDALPGQLEALPLLPDVGVRGPEEPDDVVEHRTHGTGPHMEHHASVPAKDSPAPPHRGRPGSTDRPPNGDRTGRLARPVLSVTLWS